MLCQIPGCKNKGIKATTKEGIFLGVHLENVMIWTCGKHSKEEIEIALENVGDDEATYLQHDACPFLEVQKLCKKSS
jgi:hypothetical protein